MSPLLDQGSLAVVMIPNMGGHLLRLPFGVKPPLMKDERRFQGGIRYVGPRLAKNNDQSRVVGVDDYVAGRPEELPGFVDGLGGGVGRGVEQVKLLRLVQVRLLPFGAV